MTPRIAALADRLAGTESASSAVSAFWNYLMDTLRIGAIRYDEVSADTAVDGLLDGNWCDCQLGSALFISLCRARGLPARMLGGHFLYRLAPTKHYWAEVWLDGQGWLPFDCLSWDLSAGGQDATWRNWFAGRIDHRMATECFPRSFLGPMSVRLPPAWQMLQTASGAGIEVAFSDVATGSPVFGDCVWARQYGPTR